MIARLLVYLCDVSPAIRRWLWRWWYSKLAKKIGTERWTFMNYGFAPEGEEPIALQPSDEADRLCIQLYDRVARPADIRGKDVLEVGSGRGGGASYLTRYHSPTSYTGVDFSPHAVTLCQERHREIAGLKFAVGDAENLSFPDASFDCVVNVESSHCYGNVGKFLSEACRVLRPGGWFVFADLRDPRSAVELESTIRAQAWSVVEKEEITPGVRRALAADDARKSQLISEFVPEKLRPLFAEFAGLEGGKISEGFRSGDLVYMRFACRK